MTHAIVIARDKEIEKLVQKAIEGLPIKISAYCTNLKAAIEVFRQGSIRIAILDLFLGESTGLEAIKTLKKMDDTLTIILITRVRGRVLLERAFRYGAGDTLVYPCEAGTLRETLRHRLDQLGDEMVVFHQS